MPFGHHFSNLSELNKGYIYTNYDKESIRLVASGSSKNNVPVYYAKKKDDVQVLKLDGVKRTRTGYNTITPPTTWQKYFFSEMDLFFNTDKNNRLKNEVNIKKFIDLSSVDVFNSIIVNAEIDSFDNFIKELKERSRDVEYKLSQFNLEKLYNLLCFNILKEQSDERTKYNVARSWRTLRASLNAWFQTRTNLLVPEQYYGIIVNDLLKENSNLKNAIYKSLLKFREVVGNKTEYDIQSNLVTIPVLEQSYTSDFVLHEKISKYALDKFYLKDKYPGRENEFEFINHIDASENVEWWYKQSDTGQDVFGCVYSDSANNKEDVFNPDFIIKTKKTLYILDTKSGLTLRDPKTADKSRGLQEWIRINSSKFENNIVGGIVVKEGPIWKINSSRTFDYKLQHQWNDLKLE
jgi:type III restriction enzyme